MNNYIQNWNTMEGKKAKGIYYGENGEYAQEAEKREGYTKEIISESQNLGEYKIVWFVVYENGTETSRHNAKFIETIVWEVKNET